MFRLFCLFLVFIKSDDIEVDGFTYRIQNKQATVIDCAINDSILTIPPTVTVEKVIYPVIGITSGAFSTSSKKYVEIYFPNSFATIESMTFQSFTSLQKIGYINENNETIPDSLPPNVIKLEAMTFQGCSNLQKINLYNVQSIDVSCFDSCYALTKVESGNLLQSIGPSAFSSCHNLVSFTTQTSHLNTICSMAFAYCEKLEEFDFSICRDFADSAFKGTGFTYVNLSGCTTNVINSDLFSMCYKLVSVTFPQNLSALYSECFSQCTSLTSIEILSVGSDFSIERAAFQECTSLKSVVLVSQPRFIGINSFYGCISLESVTLLNPTRDQAVDLYEYCFYGCTNLTKFAFENWTLSKIEEMAFYQCPLSSNLTFFGSDQFSINNEAFQSESIQFLDFRNCQGLALTRESFKCPNLSCVIVDEDKSVIAQLAFPGVPVGLDESCLPAPTIPPTKTPMASRTPRPTQSPSQSPTQSPSQSPTQSPSQSPTQSPSQSPTEQPTEPTSQPPTEQPTQPPTPTDDSKSDKKKIIIIASSVSAVVLVIILIIVAVLIIRKRRNGQLKSQPLLTQDNNGYFMTK